MIGRWLEARLGGPPTTLTRRAYLTWRHHGTATLLWRLVSFPLRFTPLRRRLGFGNRWERELDEARAWYRDHGRPVTVVIPTYGPPELTIETVRSVRATVDLERVRIVVADDGSEPPDVERLRQLEGEAEIVLGTENSGFAANANRGLRLAVDGPAGGDVVLLNNDVLAHDGWLELLQHAAHASPEVGIVGPKLLYPDGRIQSAGSHRNLGAPEWFDHRYRFKPADHGPANVPAPALAMTGACMYLKRDLLDAVGLLDEGYPMAYEDIDLCLRAWHAGFGVWYEPAAVLTHRESITRGSVQGERELSSQRRFWSKWAGHFGGREVRGRDGRLRVIYVTEDTGVGGGHRDIFEHLNRLHARGHEVALYSLGDAPEWFPLEVPVRTFEDYDELAGALAEQDAIKVATWWATADAVWRGSVLRGLPAYFVQDIETSYYDDDELMRDRVLASYRQEFSFMTISSWNGDRLRELGLAPALVPPGIDLETFRPLAQEHRTDVLLAIGRSLPLKNLDLTIRAWRSLRGRRPELWMFGIEPELGARNGARYIEAPTDEQVNELFNTATAFIQTSRHEGFCLPLLEAMAVGTPVISTDAHGNRDFCRDGDNSLLVSSTKADVARAIERLLADPELRSRLAAEGRRTASAYGWHQRIDELEAFLDGMAGAGSAAAAGTELSAGPAPSPGAAAASQATEPDGAGAPTGSRRSAAPLG